MGAFKTELQKRIELERTGESRKTVIVSGGLIERDFVLSLLKEQDFTFIICADRGLEFLSEEGIEPTHIVGDFDSLKPHILEKYCNNPNVKIRMFSPIKDKTDTEIALHLAVELRATQIWLLGANGTRVDHTLGNIQSLIIPLNAGIPCYMADAHNRICLLNRGITIKKEDAFGKYISFFPLYGEVEGLTLSGVKYPLIDHRLTCENSLGVSNEITEEKAVVSFKSGTLIMIMSKDRDD